jgi:hypothetical protein
VHDGTNYKDALAVPAAPCGRVVDPARSCLARDQLQAEAVRRCEQVAGAALQPCAVPSRLRCGSRSQDRGCPTQRDDGAGCLRKHPLPPGRR